MANLNAEVDTAMSMKPLCMQFQMQFIVARIQVLAVAHERVFVYKPTMIFIEVPDMDAP